MDTHETRLQRARIALEGLSVGDALGGFLEGSNRAHTSAIVVNRKPPDITWNWTDDSNMAFSIYEILRKHGEINQDALAASFALHLDRRRGYGSGARMLLTAILNGGDWRELSKNIFKGGSYGNGGAMRVAPLGAYFADDLPLLIENAIKSSEITHAHPEGIAGTIAVAVATAHACNLQGSPAPTRAEFIDVILPHIPESEVKSKIIHAREIRSLEIEHVVGMIGNGSRISAQDTVPFVIFCASQWLSEYEEAIWQTMSGGGDVDTTCAMVGGIVASYTGSEAIPESWIEHREPIPDWALA